MVAGKVGVAKVDARTRVCCAVRVLAFRDTRGVQAPTGSKHDRSFRPFHEPPTHRAPFALRPACAPVLHTGRFVVGAEGATMPMHPSGEWLLRSDLSDRGRLMVAILQRFGAHNRPTVIKRSDPFAWFATPDGVADAWYELVRIKALEVSDAGPDHFAVRLLSIAAQMPRPKYTRRGT